MRTENNCFVSNIRGQNIIYYKRAVLIYQFHRYKNVSAIPAASIKTNDRTRALSRSKEAAAAVRSRR